MMAFQDVVVVLPGITGSVLANAAGKEVWSATVGAVWRAVTSGGDSLTDLTLAEGSDGDGVTAPRLVPDTTIVPGLIKIDGYSGLMFALQRDLGLTPGKNLHAFPYDWRLDNRVNARRLQSQAMAWLHDWRTASGAKDARLVLVAHSMGGLVSRYFLECLGGWQDTRWLVTLGTPHRGSVNAIDSLVHGLKKGIGPFGLDLSPLLRSLPSVYQLLPIYPCVDMGDGQLARVAEVNLPNVRTDRAVDALAFHREIEAAQAANAQTAAYREQGYNMAPMVGISQPTYQSARVVNGAVELLRSLEGTDHGGDGTVPRVSATPIELSKASREIYAAEMHGSLQNGGTAQVNLHGLLTRPDVDLSRLRRDMTVALSLDMPDALAPGEPLVLRARAERGEPTIRAHLTEIGTGRSFTETLGRGDNGWRQAELALPPGTWRVRIEAKDASPVTDVVAVAG